jgi:hypothetical protein
MATKDIRIGSATSGLISDHDKPKVALLERERDFSVTGNTVAASDVVQFLNVPAGFLVQGALVETLTVEWSTSTPCQLGDGNDTDGYLTTALCNLNSTSTDIATSTVAYGGGRGKYYPAADSIDLIPNVALDAAKVRVAVWGLQLKPGRGNADTVA